ncbi:UNVERIFIED_CONTAM: hypothetical protein Sindi_2145100 [Sesamum indicum]
MLNPSSCPPSSSTRIHGSEFDMALPNELLTRNVLINRRCRRVQRLPRICRKFCWALVKELKLKYRGYYWEQGKSLFYEAE